MNTQKLLLGAAVLCGFAWSLSCEVSAQSPDSSEKKSRVDLFSFDTTSPTPTSPSDMRRSAPTAMELRQERALYQMRQRIARLEAAAWMGYNPLRPNWNSQPMMTSRYVPQRVIYVPVYSR
jgi:hypothetical protein